MSGATKKIVRLNNEAGTLNSHTRAQLCVDVNKKTNIAVLNFQPKFPSFQDGAINPAAAPGLDGAPGGASGAPGGAAAPLLRRGGGAAPVRSVPGRAGQTHRGRGPASERHSPKSSKTPPKNRKIAKSL